FMKQEKTLIFPGEESYPTPRIGYRVTFVDHLIRGLATPIHKFLRGLLFVYGKTSQEYELEMPEDDSLLDALSLLEIYGDEVRQSISDAKAAFSRLFPYFFPKTYEPNTSALTKRFIPKEDLGLALRQENLKIGVEGTIALVAESQQSVDWAKVGDVKDMETKKWQSMIKAAKPSSKKILSFLGYKPTLSPSASKPEVK
ncbi:hypothetical protein QYE76_017976, partial [Lolium multiflorum]